MTDQMVLYTWKQLLAQRNSLPVPSEAEEYVLGDDSAFDKIPRKCYWMTDPYPQQLIDELDGDGAETAKRCLRANAVLNKNGMIMHDYQLPILFKIGFELPFLLSDDGLSSLYFMNAEVYSYYAQEIYKLVPDQAVKYITPDYLRHSLDNPSSKPRSVILALYIAIELILDGKLAYNDAADVIGRFCEYADNGLISFILSRIYHLDSKLRGKLAGLLSNPENIYAIKNTKNGTKRIEQLCEEFGCEQFIYAAMVGRLGSEERTKAVKTVAESPDYLLPLMFAMAVSRSFVDKHSKSDVAKFKQDLPKIIEDIKKGGSYFTDALKQLREKHADIRETSELYCLARPLAAALKNGCGKEILSTYEMFFTEMLISISDNFVIDKTDSDQKAVYSPNAAMQLAHLINDDPDNAAHVVHFHSNARFTVYSGASTIEVFSLLYDYSQRARDIIYTFVKACEYHGNINHFNALHKICDIFCDRRRLLDIPLRSSVNTLLECGMPINLYFTAAVIDATEVYYSDKSYACTPEIVKEHMNEAVSFYELVKDDAKQAAFWAEMLFKKAGCHDIKLLLSLFKSKSKNVRKIASDIVSADEDSFRPLLEESITKLKGDGLKQAKEIIKKWDNNKKYGKDFTFTSNSLAEEYVSENANAAADKKLAFIPESYFNNVRFADMNGKASAAYIRHIIGEYLCLSEPFRISVCDKLAAMLYAPDLHECLENIYQNWLENGADNKTKIIMVPYCIYASDTQLLALKKQLAVWAENSRGALGAYVVNAIALNGGSTALMMVNDISAKFPNNMIKKAAKSAFSFAAKALGVAPDVLADKIVPTLGLDKNGEAVLDYGERTFTLSLMPDFSISIHDNDKNKDVKSLPKPAANDDPVKAEAAKKYLSDLKKQLKAVTAAQKSRMEAVFRNGRTWTSEAWNALFVENPVMHRFASTLIWGTYENGKLSATFRYTDDGTFCDENDDSFTLPENAEISLVHPIELSDETAQAWMEQLSDYEITQPFAHITAVVNTLKENDIGEDNRIAKYIGKTFTVASMNNTAKKYNLIRSTVEDGGGFSGYHIQDRVLDIGLKIGFEGMYMGQAYDEEDKLTDVYFYRLPENDEQPNSYEDYDAIPISGISPRFISCCIDIIEEMIN